jgi:hypothetical protein
VAAKSSEKTTACNPFQIVLVPWRGGLSRRLAAAKHSEGGASNSMFPSPRKAKPFTWNPMRMLEVIESAQASTNADFLFA